MKRHHPEQDLQKAVIQWLAIAAPDLLYFHVPNAINVRGGQKAGAFNKAMGVRPGVADLCFVLPSIYTYFGITRVTAGVAFIELKAPGTAHRESAQNENQKQFQKDCKRIGAPYAICDTLEAVEGTLRGWGVELRGSVAA